MERYRSNSFGFNETTAMLCVTINTNFKITKIVNVSTTTNNKILSVVTLFGNIVKIGTMIC